MVPAGRSTQARAPLPPSARRKGLRSATALTTFPSLSKNRISDGEEHEQGMGRGAGGEQEPQASRERAAEEEAHHAGPGAMGYGKLLSYYRSPIPVEKAGQRRHPPLRDEPRLWMI